MEKPCPEWEGDFRSFVEEKAGDTVGIKTRRIYITSARSQITLAATRTSKPFPHTFKELVNMKRDIRYV